MPISDRRSQKLEMTYPLVRTLWRFYRKAYVTSSSTRQDIAVSHEAFGAGVLATLRVLSEMLETGDSRDVLSAVKGAGKEIRELQRFAGGSRH
jgi:hypothetical protein